MKSRNPAVLLLLCAACAVGHVWAGPDEDLTGLTLEQLMSEPVTSVAKKQTRIGDSAAAVTVISSEDLRRMGITSLPEALRLVPGMDVGRIGPSDYAVSARGFNSEYANKLLVLIDGRTVYTPASGGVFWDYLDVMIEDIDRIEVIRGPGASLWGANAVNGVVNIITKSARDTQGGLVVAGAGHDEQALASVRYGSRVGDDLAWRTYLEYSDHASLEDTTRTIDQGDWHIYHAGARADWQTSSRDQLMVQAEAFNEIAGKWLDIVSVAPTGVFPTSVRAENHGADVLLHWTRALTDTSDLSVQSFFDNVDQGDGGSEERRNTYDIEMQHGFRLGSRNDLLWGAGLRYVTIQEAANHKVYWIPDAFDLNFLNLFVQDEATLIPNRLRLILGSKFERSNLSGWFVDPTVRLAWTPTDHQTLWLAVSRASRTPSELELSGNVPLSASQESPNSTPVVTTIFANPKLSAEQLVAYEGGTRFELADGLSFDLAAFFNRYSGLIGVDPAGVFPYQSTLPILVKAWQQQNTSNARSYGFEGSARWQPVSHWRMDASFTFLHVTTLDASTDDTASPEYQAQVRSHLDLPWHFELNSALYYVGSTRNSVGAQETRIPKYARGDVGIVWKYDDSIQVGVWGTNVFDNRHVEFSSITTSSLFPVSESWLIKATWKF